jgi:hypothetical protein
MSRFLLIEELEIFFVVLEDISDAELNVSLSAFHGVELISKSKFRLNHPKLGHVPACMRHLSSEGRPKGIDVGKRAAKVLYCQLSRDC